MQSLFRDTLTQRILLADGGTGTLIQARDWDLEQDFLGYENCSEILNYLSEIKICNTKCDTKCCYCFFVVL